MKRISYKRVYYSHIPHPFVDNTVEPSIIDPKHPFYWKLSMNIDDWLTEYIKSICDKKAASSKVFWLSKRRLSDTCHKYCDGDADEFFDCCLWRLIDVFNYHDGDEYISPSEYTPVIFPTGCEDTTFNSKTK